MEVAEDYELNYQEDGSIYGQRGFLVCAEVWNSSGMAAYGLPQPGDTFPGETRAECRSVRVRPIGALNEQSVADCTTGFKLFHALYRFSTFSRIDAAPVDSYDVSVQMLNTGEGRAWAGVSTAVGFTVLSDDPVSTPTYILCHGHNVVADDSNLAAIASCQNKVNNATFDGYPAGAVLFESAPSSSTYDYQRAIWIWRIQYRFQIRLPDADGTQRGWNDFWRTPQYQVGSTGIFKLDTNGQQIPIADARGVAGWDTYDPVMYASVDMTTLGLSL
jgi:hypothetical protein